MHSGLSGVGWSSVPEPSIQLCSLPAGFVIVWTMMFPGVSAIVFQPHVFESGSTETCEGRGRTYNMWMYTLRYMR